MRKGLKLRKGLLVALDKTLTLLCVRYKKIKIWLKVMLVNYKVLICKLNTSKLTRSKVAMDRTRLRMVRAPTKWLSCQIIWQIFKLKKMWMIRVKSELKVQRVQWLSKLIKPYFKVQTYKMMLLEVSKTMMYRQVKYSTIISFRAPLIKFTAIISGLKQLK